MDRVSRRPYSGMDSPTDTEGEVVPLDGLDSYIARRLRYPGFASPPILAGETNPRGVLNLGEIDRKLR